jgi:hypothetical protein
MATYIFPIHSCSKPLDASGNWTDVARNKKREDMLKFRTWEKYIRFLLIALIFLVVAGEVFAEQEEQEGETVYPVPPPLVYQGLFPCQACHRKDVRGVSSQVSWKVS